jgi:hypothetical protein
MAKVEEAGILNKLEYASKLAAFLNLTVPDGEPKWVVKEILGNKWTVLRYSE